MCLARISKKIENYPKRLLAKNESNVKKPEIKYESAKQVTSNTEQDLKTLEKLGKLRKSGILTEKEFQEKKKKILLKI